MDKIEKILSKAEDLPVLPHIGMEILSLIDAQNTVPTDFQNVIENDQVLTLKILKLANSAYYGYPREIIRIKDAIVILGLDTLKSLVLSLLTRQMLSKGLNSYGLKRGELWEHSLAVGMIARSVAKQLKLPNHEKFFIAGLLHDIGKLLLDFYLQDYVENIKYAVNEGGLSFTEAEERMIGYDHAFIGSKLIELWNLPDFLMYVIRYHHLSDDDKNTFKREAFIIDVADRLSYSIARGSSSEFMVDRVVNPNEFVKIGLSVNEINSTLTTIKASLEMIKF